jgi:hypothetical protein
VRSRERDGKQGDRDMIDPNQGHGPQAHLTLGGRSGPRIAGPAAAI